MSRRRDLRDVAARCAANEGDAVLAEAVAGRNLVAVLVVAIFDVPVIDRLWLLFDQPGGPEIVSAIAVEGVVHDCAVTELAFEAIEKRGDQLPLDVNQADEVLERLASTEHPVDVQRRADVLQWVAAHHRDAALA